MHKAQWLTEWSSGIRVDIKPQMRVELGEFKLSEPLEEKICLSDSCIISTLAKAERTASSFINFRSDTTRPRFGPVGEIAFIPANVPFINRIEKSFERVLLCTIDSRLLLEWRGNSDWNEPELNAGINVNNANIRRSLQRIAQEIESPGFASNILMETLLISTLIEFLRGLETISDLREVSQGRIAPWQLRRIKERVEDNCDALPSIEELAGLCGISSRHLARVFKKSMDCTLHEYVENVRMERAKRLLRDSNLPLKTIAWQLGFTHASSFSIAFRRAAGLTASEYRKQCGIRWSEQ